MIAGWVFVATLDHEADQGADESVGSAAHRWGPS